MDKTKQIIFVIRTTTANTEIDIFQNLPTSITINALYKFFDAWTKEVEWSGTIDFGDGTLIQTINSEMVTMGSNGNSSGLPHVYRNPGIYSIMITVDNALLFCGGANKGIAPYCLSVTVPKNAVSPFIGVKNAFEGFTLLKVVSPNIFECCLEQPTLERCFRNCASIRYIPSNIFSKNTQLIGLAQAFNGCRALLYVSPYLLKYLPRLRDVRRMFNAAGNEESQSLPDTLFSYIDFTIPDITSEFACYGLIDQTSGNANANEYGFSFNRLFEPVADHMVDTWNTASAETHYPIMIAAGNLSPSYVIFPKTSSVRYWNHAFRLRENLEPERSKLQVVALPEDIGLTSETQPEPSTIANEQGALRHATFYQTFFGCRNLHTVRMPKLTIPETYINFEGIFGQCDNLHHLENVDISGFTYETASGSYWIGFEDYILRLPWDIETFEAFCTTIGSFANASLPYPVTIGIKSSDYSAYSDRVNTAVQQAANEKSAIIIPEAL